MDYYTTALCKANIPADIIKDIVGWESTNMVSLYNDTEVDEELGKYFDVIYNIETFFYINFTLFYI